MLVAYFDETYKEGKEHALVALVLPADQISELEKGLNSVIAKAKRQHDLPEDIELHGYELSGGEGDWSNLAPRARVRIYQEAIEVIASISGAAICHGSVDLQSRSPRDAHRWALTFALECVNGYAHGQGQNVIGICDDVGNKLVYQRMYDYARRYGTEGRYKNTLQSFTDGLHFTPSSYSRPVQAVDLVAYVYRKNVLFPFKDPRAKKAMTGMYDSLKTLWTAGCHRTW